MGRGGSQEQALNEARDLLFGPRRPRPLSPEKRKAKRREESRMVREEKQLAYYESVIEAGKYLKSGDGNHLDIVLEEKAAHGLKGVEKESLRDLIDEISDFALAAGEPSDSSTEMINSRSELAGLVRLYRRSEELSLPRRYRHQARESLLIYSQALANQEIIDNIDEDQVDPLPNIVFGRDFSDHLTKGGQPICGVDLYNSRIGQKHQDQEFVIEKEVDCERCREIFSKERSSCDYSKAWIETMKNSSLNNWGWRRPGLVNETEGKAEDQVDYLVDSLKEMSTDILNNNIAPYSDYRFC